MVPAPARPSGKYPIRVVARLTGIPIDTLRAWERRYGAVEPARDDRGRLYDDVDLQKLKLLRRLVERGHAIGRIANLGEPELGKLLEAGLEPADRGREGRRGGPGGACSTPSIGTTSPRWTGSWGSSPRCSRPARWCTRWCCRSCARSGKGWQEGRFTVAQEHMVSASLRGPARLAGPGPGAAGRPDRPGLRHPAGERHELGLAAAAMLAAAGGLGVVYLGADLPASGRRRGGPADRSPGGGPGA